MDEDVKMKSADDGTALRASSDSTFEGFKWTHDGYLAHSIDETDIQNHMKEEDTRNDTDKNDESVPLLESARGLLKLIQHQIHDPVTVPVDDEEFQNLKHEPMVLERARKVICDIDKMKVLSEENKRRNRNRHEHVHRMKIESLQRQQKARLTKQKKNSSEDLDIDCMDANDACENNSNPALVRFVRTLNSIRAVFPLLIAMMHHPRRSDKEVVIQEKSLSKMGRKKGGKAWIIGSHVFDFGSNTQIRKIEQELKRILESVISPENKSLKKHLLESAMEGKGWEKLIPKCFPKQSIRPCHPIEALVARYPSDVRQEKQDIILSNGNLVDSTFVPILQNRLYHSEYQRAIARLLDKLSNIIRRKYKDATLHVYGSCLSDLALGTSSDVDISLRLPEALRVKEDFDEGRISADLYERQMKTFVFRIADKIRSWNDQGFGDIEPVARARVPVIKGNDWHASNPYSKNGSISFDICFLNDIAVVNSSLLKEYSLVDPRAKLLMLIVKAWARDAQVNSAADNTLSSYAWMNLVIFYLQCLDFVPNFQDPELMAKCGVIPDPRNNFHFVNGLETAFATWEQVECGGYWKQPETWQGTPVTLLLYGFFHFYANYPQNMTAVSMRLGYKYELLKTEFEGSRLTRLCIEDPFETVESHCPHDLGMPCGEKGYDFILEKIQAMAEKLAHQLCKDAPPSLKSIWPKVDGGLFTRHTKNPDQPLKEKARKRPQNHRPDNRIRNPLPKSKLGHRPDNRSRNPLPKKRHDEDHTSSHKQKQQKHPQKSAQKNERSGEPPRAVLVQHHREEKTRNKSNKKPNKKKAPREKGAGGSDHIKKKSGRQQIVTSQEGGE